MNKKVTKQLRLPLMAVLFVLAGKAAAQGIILEKTFKSNSSSTVSVDDGTDSEGWTFSNCHAIGNSYLQIGNSTADETGNGSVKTPDLSKHHITLAKATIEVYNYYNDDRVFSVVGTNCSLNKTSYTAYGKKNTRYTTFLSDFSNSPSFTINSTGGSAFELKKVKIQNIGNVIFFESFDKMIAVTTNKEFAFDGPTPEKKAYDNPPTTAPPVFSGNQCIYLVQTGPYTTPSIATTPNKRYILFFRISGVKGGIWEESKHLTVSCSGGSLSETNFQPSQQEEWLDCQTIITATSNSIQLSFSGKGHLLDEVLVTELPTITLVQTDDNGSVITRDMNQLRTVELRRPLIKDNWNTMCLPFAVSRDIIATALGSGANPEVRTLTSISDGVFNFAVNTGTVAAGTPFLLKVDKEVTEPWTIRDVVIEQEEPLQLTFDNANGYKLAGTYSPVDLAVDGTNVFLGTDGILYSPAIGNNTMNGMRAYFIIPSGHSARVQQEESSGIATMMAAPLREASTYDLTGRRMPDSIRQPGLYIQGGRKVIVR